MDRAPRPSWLTQRWPLAWAALTAAFALHVLDEATHDFLSWYNPSALRLREYLGGLPFPPAFTFPVWLAGLGIAILALAALTPLVRPGRRWVVIAAYAYGLRPPARSIRTPRHQAARRNRSASCSSRSFPSRRASARMRSTCGRSLGSPQR
jgi:hypothetical protein